MRLPESCPRGKWLIAAGVAGLCCYALGPVMLLISVALIVVGVLTLS